MRTGTRQCMQSRLVIQAVRPSASSDGVQAFRLVMNPQASPVVRALRLAGSRHVAEAVRATARSDVVRAFRPAVRTIVGPRAEVGGGLSIAIAVYAFGLASAASAQVAPAAAPAIVIVKAARLVDGGGGPPITPAMVRIDGER